MLSVEINKSGQRNKGGHAPIEARSGPHVPHTISCLTFMYNTIPTLDNYLK